MSRKRMRYQWFQDIPRNVTHREYQQFQLRSFGAIGLGLIAMILAWGSISGQSLETSRELAEIDEMSIKDAATYGGDRIDLIQLEGYLVTDTPLMMPDDATQKVIRGRVNLVASADVPTLRPVSVSPPPNTKTNCSTAESINIASRAKRSIRTVDIFPFAATLS